MTNITNVHNHPPRRPPSSNELGVYGGVALNVCAVAAVFAGATVIASILIGVGCMLVVLGVML
jgi:hypothetical protein